MLRRPPTLITLTPEDVAAYEDSRLARLARASSLQNKPPTYNHSQGSSVNATKKTVALDPSDELKPLPGDKARLMRYGPAVGAQTPGHGSAVDASRARTREERIGG